MAWLQAAVMPHYALSGQPVKAEQQTPLLCRRGPMNQACPFITLPFFTFEYRHLTGLQLLDVIHR
ncbi:hypothetical protein D3C80_2070290 [compost metagenome]